MRNVLIAIILFALLPSSIQAQCNKSAKTGHHIVQEGENLYRISLKYGVKMADICAWNDIRIDQILPSCKELRVSPLSTNYARLTSNNDTEFTERGFSTNTVPVAEAISSAPASPPVTTEPSTSTPPPATSVISTINTVKRQAGKRHTVQYGETMKRIAEAYGYTEARLREINVMKADEYVTEGSILITSDCSCEILPHTDVHSTTNHTDAGQGSHIPSEYSDKGISGESTSSDKNAFMQSEEQAMVDEINLLRSNPGAYTKYVREYLEKSKSGKGFPTDEATVNELIAELNRTSPLSQLEVTECIYNAARKHGIDELSRGSTGHVGSDGSYPWDRVIKECPQMREGGENIVGGPDNVRDAVILLLIDQGIADRGHRRTLLNKDWKYVACYKVGKVGSMPNSWVQNFGY